MSRVRVRLRMDELRLEFEGEQHFFDRWVAPLVEAAYVRRGEAPVEAGSRVHASVSDESILNDVHAQGSDTSDTSDASDQAPAPAPAPALEPAAPPEGYRPNSAHFARFVRQVGERAAKPDQQVMAFAFFLWNYEQVETWGVDEIRGCFGAVGLPVPDDLLDIIADLTTRRRFLESSDAGVWKSTRKGVNYVKNRLLASS